VLGAGRSCVVRFGSLHVRRGHCQVRVCDRADASRLTSDTVASEANDIRTCVWLALVLGGMLTRLCCVCGLLRHGFYARMHIWDCAAVALALVTNVCSSWKHGSSSRLFCVVQGAIVVVL
jgi:hypothetical protein